MADYTTGSEVNYNVRWLTGSISRRISFILAIVFFASTVTAGDFATYRNSQFKYAIIYPTGWKIANDDGKVFSVLNNSSDVNINVVADQLTTDDKIHYNRITDIPNIREEMTASIKKAAKIPTVESGTTVLSNEPALWFKFNYIHRSIDVELYFVVYQVSVLKNDNRYTITAKVSGPSKVEAETKFNKYWPTIKTSIVSFTLTELAK